MKELSVAIAFGRSEVVDEFHERIVAIVGGLDGFECFGVRDGDPRGLTADILILYRNARAFSAYARLLRGASRRRPVTAIWQLDPLPPAEFDPVLEQRALDRLRFPWPSKFVRRLAAPLRRPLYEAIRRQGLGPYSTEIDRSEVDAGMVRVAMEAYAYIHHGLKEGWIDRVFATTTGKRRFLESRGIATTAAVPAGYDPLFGSDRGEVRDVDVVFLGSLKNFHRRQRVFEIAEALAAKGRRMLIVDRDCYGEERAALLNRTRLVLHVQKYPWDTPWMRWGMAAACGAAVVSETLPDRAPFEPGVHYFEAEEERLPEFIEGVLREPERISTVSGACLAFMREAASTERSLSHIMLECARIAHSRQ